MEKLRRFYATGSFSLIVKKLLSSTWEATLGILTSLLFDNF